MNLKIIAAGVAAAAVGIGSFALSDRSSAAPSATHHAKPMAASSSETFYINGINGKEGAVATGTFTGAGKDIATESTDLLKLGNGTVKLKHGKATKVVPKIHSKTCFAALTIYGKYHIVKGTGAYKGVTGHGKYVVHSKTVLPRKSNGKCDTKTDPRMEIFTIKAHGPAKLS